VPYAPNAWVVEDKSQIGYELSLPATSTNPRRSGTLEEIRADIWSIGRETDGLLAEIVGTEPVIDGWRHTPRTRLGLGMPGRGTSALGSWASEAPDAEVDDRSSTGDEEMLSVSTRLGSRREARKNVTSRR